MATYTDYWKDKAKDAAVPGEEPQRFFIGKMFGLAHGGLTLDLGCGHGRVYPVIATFTSTIQGLDISEEAISESKKHRYREVSKGTAEETGLPSDYFDKVIAWGVYDMVEQEQALLEENRILKQSGLLLITGKNTDYCLDDTEAVVAEKNAKAKGFPNHFTDVYGLIERIGEFGFVIEQAYGFKCRGDWAAMKYFPVENKNKIPFYEFLLIVRKTGQPYFSGKSICSRESIVSKP